MTKAAVIAAAEPVCRRTAESEGLELIEVALDTERTGKYLRIYVDKTDGITLDDCERYHKAVRPLLDSLEYDFMEVSSPGADRPLKTERDYERHLGDKIEIRFFKPVDGVKIKCGILAGLDGTDILLDGPGGQERIPIKSAALVKPVLDLEGIEDVDLSDTETDADG